MATKEEILEKLESYHELKKLYELQDPKKMDLRSIIDIYDHTHSGKLKGKKRLYGDWLVEDGFALIDGKKCYCVVHKSETERWLSEALMFLNIGTFDVEGLHYLHCRIDDGQVSNDVLHFFNQKEYYALFELYNKFNESSILGFFSGIESLLSYKYLRRWIGEKSKRLIYSIHEPGCCSTKGAIYVDTREFLTWKEMSAEGVRWKKGE